MKLTSCGGSCIESSPYSTPLKVPVLLVLTIRFCSLTNTCTVLTGYTHGGAFLLNFREHHLFEKNMPQQKMHSLKA